MTNSCIVRGCRNIRKTSGNQTTNLSGVKFHGFPKDPEKRKIWLSIVPIKGKFYETAKICSDHFKKEDYCTDPTSIARLRKDAVPFYSFDIKNQDVTQPQAPKSDIKDSSSELSPVMAKNEKDKKPLAMRICKICLCWDVKMYHIKEYNLEEMYQNVLGIPPRLDEGFPQGVCWECAARLSAAESFRTKAMLADALLNGEPLNFPDLIQIHRDYKSLKSTLAIQNVFNIQMIDDQKSKYKRNTIVKTDSIDIPNVEEKAIDNDSEKDTKISITEEENETIDEQSIDNNSDQDIDKTRTDVSVGMSDDFDAPFQDGFTSEENFSDMENKDNFNYEDMKQNDDDIIFIVLAENEKKVDSSDVKENGDETAFDLEYKRDVPNMSKVLEENMGKPYVRLEKLKLPSNEVEDKKGVKRKAAEMSNDDEEEHVQTKRKTYHFQTIPIDENVFSIRELKKEDLLKEIQDRKNSARYKNAPYRCNICYVAFNTKDRQERHEVKHSAKRGPFKCEICKIRLKKRLKLKSHWKNVHTNEYKCKLCNMSTRNKSVAIEHMRFHAGEKYECSKCNIRFRKKTTLYNHMRLKHVSDYVCELCGHTFINQKGVRTHKIIVHDIDSEKAVKLEGPYCEDCDVKFLSKEAYDKHLRISAKHIQDEDPIRISNDPTVKNSFRITRKETFVRKFDRAEGRMAIRKRDEDTGLYISGPITCEQCNEEFETYGAYSYHFRKQHPGKNKSQFPSVNTPFMCEHCGKLFCNRTFLEGHMWVHTGQKGFQCDICHKSFTLKATLALHMKVHGTSRPAHPCPICGNLFSFTSNLKRHIFLHTGLRPFQCSDCEKNFPTIEQLRQHKDHVHLKKPWPERVRTGEKKREARRPVEH